MSAPAAGKDVGRRTRVIAAAVMLPVAVLGVLFLPSSMLAAAVGALMMLGLWEWSSLAGLPAPDLFIRTGGDVRISNFLLWQMAYTDMWFTETLWPDLDETTLRQALDDYANRERRFGLTSAQVSEVAR